MDVYMMNKLVNINKNILPDFLNYYLNKFILDKLTFIFSSIPGPTENVTLKNHPGC